MKGKFEIRNNYKAKIGYVVIFGLLMIFALIPITYTILIALGGDGTGGIFDTGTFYDFGGELDKSGDEIEFVDYAFTFSNTSNKVISFYSGRELILELTDNSENASVQIYHVQDKKMSGTVKFWMLLSDSDGISTMDFRDGLDSVLVSIILGQGYLRYPGGQISADENVWYQIQLDFEFTDGNYKNLNYSSVNIYVNDILVSENRAIMLEANQGFERFTFQTGIVESNYSCYLDDYWQSW